MIEQIPLFFEKSENRYYYVGYCKCKRCNNIIKKSVIIIHTWGKKYSDFGLYCLACFNKIPDDIEVVKEARGAKIALERPKNAFPIIIRPPALVGGKGYETVFSMAEKQVDSEEVIDNTRLAGRESLEGAKIGCDVKDLPNKTKVLGHKAADEFLALMGASKPIIPKQLEEDKDKS